MRQHQTQNKSENLLHSTYQSCFVISEFLKLCHTLSVGSNNVWGFEWTLCINWSMSFAVKSVNWGLERANDLSQIIQMVYNKSSIVTASQRYFGVKLSQWLMQKERWPLHRTSSSATFLHLDYLDKPIGASGGGGQGAGKGSQPFCPSLMMT